MKRESIIRLMWISLGIHVGYFLLEAIVAMGQRQIMALSMAPDFEGTVFPVPYLLAGSAVYLVIHGILTVILAGQLERGGHIWGASDWQASPLSIGRSHFSVRSVQWLSAC